MQENILVLKRVKLLVLADPGAEGLDCCQAAATRGFPDSCATARSRLPLPLCLPGVNTFCSSHGTTPRLHCRHRDTSRGEAVSAAQSPEREAMATKPEPNPSLLRSREQRGNPAPLTPPPPHGISSSTVNNNTTRPNQAAGSVCKFRTYRKCSVCKELLPVPSLSSVHGTSLWKLPPPPSP